MLELHADDARRRHEHLIGRAPDARGCRAAAMSRATSMPASPVHALAQPLLMTIAAACPPEPAPDVRARRTTGRGHGLIGREHRRRRTRARRRNQRQGPAARRGDAGLLDSAATRRRLGIPAASVTPPSTICDTNRTLGATATRRGGPRPVRRPRRRRAARSHHRVLLAPCGTAGTSTQSVAIFSGSQRCGTIEKFWRTKNRASCVKAHRRSRTRRSARAGAARRPAARRGRRDGTVRRPTSDRTSRDARRERRQLRAGLDVAVDARRSTNRCRVPAELFELARQQVSFRDVRADQRGAAPRRLSAVAGSHDQISQRSCPPMTPIVNPPNVVRESRRPRRRRRSLTICGGSSRIDGRSPCD